MNLKQATDLWDTVTLDLGKGAASLYQIASGEWVIRIRAGDFWLWSPQDYKAYRGQAMAPVQAPSSEEERSYSQGISTGETFQLALPA